MWMWRQKVIIIIITCARIHHWLLKHDCCMHLPFLSENHIFLLDWHWVKIFLMNKMILIFIAEFVVYLAQVCRVRRAESGSATGRRVSRYQCAIRYRRARTSRPRPHAPWGARTGSLSCSKWVHLYADTPRGRPHEDFCIEANNEPLFSNIELKVIMCCVPCVLRIHGENNFHCKYCTIKHIHLRNTTI